MRKILLLVTLIAVSTITFHPHNVSAASFDCSKASTAVEGSICANPTLSALDKKLADVYRQVRSASSDTGALRQAQLAWMKTRNACGANVQCLEQSYRQRISELQPSAPEPVDCFDNESQLKALAGYSGSYRTIISDADRMNSAGQPIKGFRAFLGQDRANVNRFNRGEASEEPDTFFATPERRTMLRDAQIRSRCGQNIDDLIRQLEAQGSTIPLNVYIVSSGPQLWVYLDPSEASIVAQAPIQNAEPLKPISGPPELQWLLDSNKFWIADSETQTSGRLCSDVLAENKATMILMQYTPTQAIQRVRVGGLHPRRNDPVVKGVANDMAVDSYARYEILSTEPTVRFNMITEPPDRSAVFTSTWELDIDEGTLKRVSRESCTGCNAAMMNFLSGRPETAIRYWCADKNITRMTAPPVAPASEPTTKLAEASPSATSSASSAQPQTGQPKTQSYLFAENTESQVNKNQESKSHVEVNSNAVKCQSGKTDMGEKISLSKCVAFINQMNKSFNQPLTFQTGGGDFSWNIDK